MYYIKLKTSITHQAGGLLCQSMNLQLSTVRDKEFLPCSLLSYAAIDFWVAWLAKGERTSHSLTRTQLTRSRHAHARTDAHTHTRGLLTRLFLLCLRPGQEKDRQRQEPKNQNTGQNAP